MRKSRSATQRGNIFPLVLVTVLAIALPVTIFLTQTQIYLQNAASCPTRTYNQCGSGGITPNHKSLYTCIETMCKGKNPTFSCHVAPGQSCSSSCGCSSSGSGNNNPTNNSGGAGFCPSDPNKPQGSWRAGIACGNGGKCASDANSCTSGYTAGGDCNCSSGYCCSKDSNGSTGTISPSQSPSSGNTPQCQLSGGTCQSDSGGCTSGIQGICNNNDICCISSNNNNSNSNGGGNTPGTQCIASNGTCQATGSCDPNTQTDQGQSDCSTDNSQTCCVPNNNNVPPPQPTIVPCSFNANTNYVPTPEPGCRTNHAGQIGVFNPLTPTSQQQGNCPNNTFGRMNDRPGERQNNILSNLLGILGFPNGGNWSGNPTPTPLPVTPLSPTPPCNTSTPMPTQTDSLPTTPPTMTPPVSNLPILPPTRGRSSWGGYVFPIPSTTNNAQVSATWNVSNITCTQNGQTQQDLGSWVGFGGYSQSDSYIAQLGTDDQCNNGTPSYVSWTEAFPAAPVFTNYTVRTGDQISANVTFQGNNTFATQMSDASQGWSLSTPMSFSGNIPSSGEIAIESSTGRLIPRFDPINFTNVLYSYDGVAQQPLSQAQGLVKMDINLNRTQETNTSPINGSIFSVSWLHY